MVVGSSARGSMVWGLSKKTILDHQALAAKSPGPPRTESPRQNHSDKTSGSALLQRPRPMASLFGVRRLGTLQAEVE